MECIHLTGWFFMETFIFDRWKRSHQSLAREGLRIFRFCVMPWKDEREPTIKYCLGRLTDVVQEFTTIQSFGRNWRRTDGIRVKYFPRIHYIAARPRSPKVHEQNERPRTSPRTNYLHVKVQIHRELKTMKRHVLIMPHLCLYLQKDFQQDVGHSSDLDQKRSGILSTTKDQKENGKKSQNWWW